MKLKLKILLKDDPNKLKELTGSMVKSNGTSLELVMSDFVYRWMMNEIISFWVEPAECRHENLTAPAENSG